jgi:hypothetical protein
MDDWIKGVFANALPEADQQARNIRLHELARAEVQHDIGLYFEDTFARIRRDHPDGPRLTNWPTAEDTRHLVEKTGTLFVFASTVSRFLSDRRLSPRTKLGEILDADASSAVAYPYRQLDGLYMKVLSDSIGDDPDPSHADLIQRVVATVVLAAAPLTIDALEDIIGQDVHAVVLTLSSVLLIPEQPFSSAEPVRAFHPSFHDFLTNKSRCTDARFAVDAATGHGRLAARCFERMHTGLKKDICDIRNPSLFNSDVPDLNDRIAKHIPITLRYGCLYWHFHLGLASNPDSTLSRLYESFCEERLLFSIEAASLLGELATVRNGLLALQRCTPVRS